MNRFITTAKTYIDRHDIPTWLADLAYTVLYIAANVVG